jgi:hypothetical protein
LRVANTKPLHGFTPLMRRRAASLFAILRSVDIVSQEISAFFRANRAKKQTNYAPKI